MAYNASTWRGNTTVNDLWTSRKSRSTSENWRTAFAATLQGWRTTCGQHWPTRTLMSSGGYGRAPPRKRLYKPAHATQANAGITQDTAKQPTRSESTKRQRFFQDHEQHAAFSTKATEQHRLKRQVHKIVQHVRKSKQTNRNAWPKDVRNTWENAARNEMWTQHTNVTNETPTSFVALIKTLHRAI